MNTKDYKKAWDECPDIWPAYIMTKDVDRLNGMVTYYKGTKLIGKGSDNTFKEVTNAYGGSVGLPLSAVKFLGYIDINRDNIETQFKELQNA